MLIARDKQAGALSWRVLSHPKRRIGFVTLYRWFSSRLTKSV
nr:MAG TPA: hypothetical protein [Caudoviricetes sp.]